MAATPDVEGRPLSHDVDVDVVPMPTADEIFERPAPVSPDTEIRDLLSIGVDMISSTTDDLAAAVLERLCVALADTADALGVTRLMLSEAQTVAHSCHVENVRLHQRVADLLELARGAR